MSLSLLTKDQCSPSTISCQCIALLRHFNQHINKTRNDVTMHWLEKVLDVHWSLASSNNTVHKYITLNFTAKGI